MCYKPACNIHTVYISIDPLWYGINYNHISSIIFIRLQQRPKRKWELSVPRDCCATRDLPQDKAKRWTGKGCRRCKMRRRRVCTDLCLPFQDQVRGGLDHGLPIFQDLLANFILVMCCKMYIRDDILRWMECLYKSYIFMLPFLLPHPLLTPPPPPPPSSGDGGADEWSRHVRAGPCGSQ